MIDAFIVTLDASQVSSRPNGGIMYFDPRTMRAIPHRWAYSALTIMIASLVCVSCAATYPVVVVGSNGEIFRGTTIAALNGGSFSATDGKTTCSGTYNDWDMSRTLTIPAKCTDGRTGIITAMREADMISGKGTIAVSDGTSWSFGFGSDAVIVERAANEKRSAPQPVQTMVATSQEAIYPPGTSRSIIMKKEGGTYVVPVTINDAIKLDFVVDSGASDVSIPADVVLTLFRTGTISDADFLGSRNYQLADGSTLPSPVFRIRSLRVGDTVVRNVTASVAPMQGSLLLGQSFLERFAAWSVDNNKHALVLQGAAAAR
jgi:clan AA aspartic protease (TIGR02281 family)